MEAILALDKVKEIWLKREKELESIKESLKRIGRNYLGGELYRVCATCGRECSSLRRKRPLVKIPFPGIWAK
jgi:hypothetical protein